MLSYQYLWEHDWTTRRALADRSEHAARHREDLDPTRRTRVSLGLARGRLVGRLIAWMRNLRSWTRAGHGGSGDLTLILRSRESRSVAGGSSVAVRAGTVWITDRGRDVLLTRGGTYCSNDRYAPLVVVNPLRRPATVTIGAPDARGCLM